jgi:predicted ribosome-associated RNA-binding protein Tma20
MPGKDMGGKSGKAVKSVHYVGDELWKLEQK